jgi:hypothetical protein
MPVIEFNQTPQTTIVRLRRSPIVTARAAICRPPNKAAMAAVSRVLKSFVPRTDAS